MTPLIYVSIGLALTGNCLAQLTNLFQVDFSSNLNGGCAYVGQTTLTNIATDAHGLGVVGGQLVTDYGNNVAEARRLLDSFFQVPNPPMTAAQLQAIRDKYTAVTNWIAGGGAYNQNGPVKTPPPNPFLFCYHNFLQKYSMDDPAFDEKGETFPGNPDDIGLPVLIRQVAELDQAQQTENENSGGTSAPYWFDRSKGYLFDKSYGANPRGYSPVAHQHHDPVSLAFGGVNQGFNPAKPPAINYRARNPCAGSLQPVPRAQVPPPTQINNNLQNLRQCLPTAVTMFHELFHLVLGTNVGVSYPAGGEIYNLFQGATHLVGLDYATALTNPESFANAAVAYDYTQTQPIVNGSRIEWFSGYCTQG